MPFLINIIIQLVVGVVLGLVSNLFTQANKVEQQKQSSGTRGSQQFGGKVPKSFVVGTFADAGKLEYPKSTWGNSGETPNAFITQVVSFGDMPISDLSGLYVSSSPVTISASGGVGQGYPVPEYNGKAWWKFYNGTQTAADSFLVSTFGGDADRPWTSEHVGRGVPYLITTMEWDEGLWAGGGVPQVIAQLQGIKLYDVRKDSTRGGSGSHRWANAVPTEAEQATWEFSDNNAVIIYNVLRGIYYEGQHIWGGRRTASHLSYAVWSKAMNSCDLSVWRVQSAAFERQFRAGRKISVNEEPRTVVEEFLVGCCGRIAYLADGSVDMIVGVPDEVAGSFSDADVLATNELGTIPYPRLDDLINGATATYLEPSQAWESKETAPYYRSDLEALDDGRRQTKALSLDTTFSGAQAQQVLKATVEEARRFRRHVVALRAPFEQYRPLQVLGWTNERFGYSSKRFLITARTRAFGFVVLGLQEVDAADHSWTPATDERPLTFSPVTLNRPAPQEVSGFYVEPAIWLDSQGRSRRTAYDVFWSSTSVTVDVEFVRISHRLEGETDIAWVGLIPRPDLLKGSARIVEALLPNEGYEVEIQYIAGSGRQTLSSGWLPVTTPNVKLTDLDVVYGDFDLDGLGNQVRGYFDWMGKNIRELTEQLQQIALLAGDQELANATQLHQLRRSLSVVVGDLTASFDETITTAIIPMQGQLVALADALTELSAADAGDIATARFRMTAQTGIGGGVTIGWSGRTGAAGAWREAGLFLSLPNDDEDPSQLLIDVNQLVITDGMSSLNPFVFEDGEAKMMAARIGVIRSGRIESFDGESFWDMDTGDMRF